MTFNGYAAPDVDTDFGFALFNPLRRLTRARRAAEAIDHLDPAAPNASTRRHATDATLFTIGPFALNKQSLNNRRLTTKANGRCLAFAVSVVAMVRMLAPAASAQKAADCNWFANLPQANSGGEICGVGGCTGCTNKAGQCCLV